MLKSSKKGEVMKYPKFFDEVNKIKLYDPLGEFLGAFEDGVVEVTYRDCVIMAGHSCPTVAGAYIATFNALEALFGDELPIRGEIKVELSEPVREGVIGVIGNVAAFICGVAGDSGFGGVGGRFSRRDKLEFGKGFDGDIRFTRLDTQKSVTLKIDTSVVKGDPRLMELLQKNLKGLANPQEQEEFPKLWQERVKAMVTNSSIWSKIAPIID